MKIFSLLKNLANFHYRMFYSVYNINQANVNEFEGINRRIQLPDEPLLKQENLLLEDSSFLIEENIEAE